MTLNFYARADVPDHYTDLLDYVQPAPDQGRTGTCLFMASTGAMEFILNRRHGITKPKPLSDFDLSEPFLIHAPDNAPTGKSNFETAVYKFNNGHAVHIKDWPFNAWIGTTPDMSAWKDRDTTGMRMIDVPKVETIQLFNMNQPYAVHVLTKDHVSKVKDALVKYHSPVMINYNDNNFWHVILIVGFDDRARGTCYQISPEECKETEGSFYVRDSFGVPVELRDYDWFKNKANAAFVVREASP